MRKYLITLIGLLVLAGGCSQKDTASLAGSYLPEKIASTNQVRSSEVRVYIGDSLWTYIDGGAELYHQYGFVEVATAQYLAGEIELSADIYRFDTPLNAFGLYSVLRPPVSEIIQLGVEGYCAPATLNFVKGECLVRVTGYDDTEEINNMILAMAHELDTVIPGTTSMPEEFDKLYNMNKIYHTDKYTAESFLGKIYLTGVYSRDYESNGDTLTGFIIEDTSKSIYTQWLEEIGGASPSFGFSLPEGVEYFVTEDIYYGTIIVAYQESLIVGLVNLKSNDSQMFTDWLQSLRHEL
ncbi:MAG: DUF6599 family protein [Candidatus Zixiibacteriota bacterium]